VALEKRTLLSIKRDLLSIKRDLQRLAYRVMVHLCIGRAVVVAVAVEDVIENRLEGYHLYARHDSSVRDMMTQIIRDMTHAYETFAGAVEDVIENRLEGYHLYARHDSSVRDMMTQIIRDMTHAYETFAGAVEDVLENRLEGYHLLWSRMLVVGLF
jgi:uncharacterized protein YdbL (DUF1318 family)